MRPVYVAFFVLICSFVLSACIPGSGQSNDMRSASNEPGRTDNGPTEETPKIVARSLAAPKIFISKADRRLQLFDGENLIKSYIVVLGNEPVGDKQTEGDGRTPEGEYRILIRNEKSKFYLSLGLDYPSQKDADRGLRLGLISDREHAEITRAAAAGRMPPQKTKLGGEIFIHGGGTQSDWTQGCVALSNSDIKELFDIAMNGTPVTIRP